MRYNFAREGVKTVVKNFLTNGSLQWEEGGSVPVTFGNDFSDPSKIIGVARDLRRETEGGWLTADIEWNEHMTPELEEMLTGKEAFVTIYAVSVEDDGEDEDGYRVVNKAEVRALFVTIEPDPWALAKS